MKRFVFEVPDDAAEGIIESLCEYQYQNYVPNPAYNPVSAPTEPPQIANPMTKEQFAGKRVIDWIGGIFKDYSVRANLAPVQEQVRQAADARVAEVAAATTFTIETE